MNTVSLNFPNRTDRPTTVNGSEICTFEEMAKGHAWSLESFRFTWPEDPFTAFETEVDHCRFRIHGIRPDLWKVLEPIVLERQAKVLPELPPIHVTRIHDGALVAAEVWNLASGLEVGFSAEAVDERVAKTLEDCRILNRVTSALHSNGLAWLEFDPHAVELNEDQVRITNMDWRLFPMGQCPRQLARISNVFTAGSLPISR